MPFFWGHDSFLVKSPTSRWCTCVTQGCSVSLSLATVSRKGQALIFPSRIWSRLFHWWVLWWQWRTLCLHLPFEIEISVQLFLHMSHLPGRTPAWLGSHRADLHIQRKTGCLSFILNLLSINCQSNSDRPQTKVNLGADLEEKPIGHSSRQQMQTPLPALQSLYRMCLCLARLSTNRVVLTFFVLSIWNTSIAIEGFYTLMKS